MPFSLHRNLKKKKNKNKKTSSNNMMCGSFSSKTALCSSAAACIGTSSYMVVDQVFMSQVVKNPDLRSSKETFAFSAGMGIAHYFISGMESESNLKEEEPEFDWIYEIDSSANKKKMKCDVSLACRPTCGGMAHHMSLLFEYEDGEKRVYEATNKDGKLIPSWDKETPEGSKEYKKFTKQYFSRQQVNLMAEKNKFNGKSYILTFINCQTWAQELLINLGIKLSLLSNLINFVPVVPNVLNMFHYLKENIGCKKISEKVGQQVYDLACQKGDSLKEEAKSFLKQKVKEIACQTEAYVKEKTQSFLKEKIREIACQTEKCLTEKVESFLEYLTSKLNESLQEPKCREELVIDPITYIHHEVLLKLLTTG